MAAPASSKACTHCGGTGWKMLAAASGAAARAARCDCHFARRAAELLAGARIPPRYQHCTLENFVSDGVRELERAHGLARAYSRDFPGLVDRERNGLLLYGSVGAGKTHLAVAIAQVLLERGIVCRFADHRALLKQIQSTFDPAQPATEASVVQPLLDAEVLILDDLGVGRATEWALETLHYILNHRYSQGGATLLTTNLEEGERRGMAEADTEKRRQGVILEAVEARLYSRLHDMCQFVPVHAADWRRRPPVCDLS